MEELARKIVIPVDGSKNSLRSFDYLEKMYGTKHNLDVGLLGTLSGEFLLLKGERGVVALPGGLDREAASSLLALGEIVALCAARLGFGVVDLVDAQRLAADLQPPAA